MPDNYRNIKQLRTDGRITSKRNVWALFVWMLCSCVVDGALLHVCARVPISFRGKVRVWPTQTQSHITSDLEN